MAYVDGFVLPLKTENIPAYRKMSRKAGKIWKEYGALEYHECVGDDLNVKGMVPFPKIAKAKDGETVVFAWITYKSRKQRDRINAKIMADPRIAEICDPKNPLFDFKRMVYGGFKSIVDM